MGGLLRAAKVLKIKFSSPGRSQGPPSGTWQARGEVLMTVVGSGHPLRHGTAVLLNLPEWGVYFTPTCFNECTHILEPSHGCWWT